MQQVVLTCDSVGKVTKKQYCEWRCKEDSLPEPNYVPGADLPTLSIALKERMYADDAAWRPQVLVSMLNKCFSVDSHFQLLVSMEMLNFNYPAWACTPAHYSARTGQYEAASSGNFELRDKLLGLQHFEDFVEVQVS